MGKFAITSTIVQQSAAREHPQSNGIQPRYLQATGVVLVLVWLLQVHYATATTTVAATACTAAAIADVVA